MIAYREDDNGSTALHSGVSMDSTLTSNIGPKHYPAALQLRSIRGTKVPQTYRPEPLPHFWYSMAQSCGIYLLETAVHHYDEVDTLRVVQEGAAKLVREDVSNRVEEVISSESPRIAILRNIIEVWSPVGESRT
jgi:hypothetical protein